MVVMICLIKRQAWMLTRCWCKVSMESLEEESKEEISRYLPTERKKWVECLGCEDVMFDVLPVSG
jgi:hypothetical protein